MDHAGPALSGIAPHMRPGQAQRLAQELDQEGSVFDLPRHGTSVDLDVDLSHLAPSPFGTRIHWTIATWQGKFSNTACCRGDPCGRPRLRTASAGERATTRVAPT